MLDRTVRDLFDLRTTEGMFGVEVEMEGSPIFQGDDNWSATRDGSLLGVGSREYVLRRPTSLRVATRCVTQLYSEIERAGGRFQDSMRAGVHIHLNCQSLTVRQLGVLLAAYYCFENVLVDLCGEERAGNLFCQRLKDAESISNVIYRFLNFQESYEMTRDSVRYAALNLAALGRYGSLEFRALRTPMSAAVIIEWMEMINKVRDCVNGFQSPQDVLSFFSTDGVENGIDTVFGEGPLGEKIRSVSNYQDKIREGIRDCQFWVFSTNWESVE